METDWLSILLGASGGLVLFLYAMLRLSEGLKVAAGPGMKEQLARFTGNVFTGILTGTVITILLDSSSAVIMMTIALVSAGQLTFKQSIGVVMGANIGTSVGSSIIALDIGAWAVVPMLLGLILQLAAQSPKRQAWGRVIFALGLLFFGLHTLGGSVAPLRDNPSFSEWMAGLDRPIRGIWVGGLTTVVIQSSSATVALAIKLGAQGMLNLPGGIAVMMGAELGTCSNTLVATAGQSRAAVRTGVFHLFFNLLSIFLGWLLFYPFVELIEWLSGGFSLERSIANAHLLFNVIGVVAFAPFAGLFSRVLLSIIPPKG